MALERDDAVFALVKTLTELPGPTGHEDAVQEWLVESWGRCCEDVRRTRVGNVLARVGGGGRRLLLMAHADELCLLIKSISDEGFLHIGPYYADALGYPPRWYMPLNQPALVLTPQGTVEGYFATATGTSSAAASAKRTASSGMTGSWRSERARGRRRKRWARILAAARSGTRRRAASGVP